MLYCSKLRSKNFDPSKSHNFTLFEHFTTRDLVFSTKISYDISKRVFFDFDGKNVVDRQIEIVFL